MSSCLLEARRYPDVCRALWCTMNGRNAYTKQPALQYTSCGVNKVKQPGTIYAILVITKIIIN